MPREFEIIHRTNYSYSAPVFLEPQVVRLSPRPDFFLRTIFEETVVHPAPVGSTRLLDEFDNRVTRFWFAGQTDSLAIESRLVVRLNDYNPFAILIDPPHAARLPMSYPAGSLPVLTAALSPAESAVDPDVQALAGRLLRTSDADTLGFLKNAVETLHRELFYEVRTFGPPRLAAETLRLGGGSCRDLTVVFMEICRATGIAARFVSGYTPAEEGAVPDLHAWGEAFVPGGGWLGFDPSRGVATTGLHIPLAAAPQPADAAPVSGSLRGFAQAEMKAEIFFHERFVF